MQHLFVHHLTVFRNVPVVDDDGNPVREEGTPVTEVKAVDDGPCRKDDYHGYTRNAPVDQKSVYTAWIFCDTTMDVREDDHVEVDEGHGFVRRWRVDTIETGTSMFGLHHFEIKATRVINA